MKHPLESSAVRLEKFWLYETKTFLYLVGFDDQETKFRLLKINRSIVRPKDLSEIIVEDPLTYNAEEIADILNMINEGNKQSGGVIKICTAYGIVGFVRFLNGFYLTLITQRKEVGCISGNFIYCIKATEMFPIRPKDEPESNTFRTLWKKLNKKLNQTTSEIAENRYMGLFQFVDMNKDFFFSYSYDLTRSLQYNYIYSSASIPSESSEIFEWNHHQIQELREVIGQGEALQWTMPIVHGSYQQKRFSIFGRSIDLILIARRSRHYAGTRYLKRGLNVHGKVANDCEVEQILQYDGGAELTFTSYVQMRGSIPTYWHQETSVTMPKPPILLNRVDPDYLATQDHFADLFRRYGAPILVLDLVKQHEKRPRESIVGREFRHAIEVLNESIQWKDKIRYVALDYSKITSISKGKLSKAKSKGSGFLNYGSKDKERAMAVVGDEWALMEKSLVKDQSQTQAKSKADTGALLVNLDEARKDFNSSSAPGNFSAKSSGLPAGFDSIAEINAVESKIDVLRELEEIANLTIFETGFFCSSLQYLDRVKDTIPQETFDKAQDKKVLFQSGVLRTNCIDCLDRTNGGQFAVAMRFLLISLQALGISSPTLMSLDLSKDPLLLSLMEMYGEMGDKIALQYGGSEAHKKVFAGKSVQTQSSSKQSELLTSIKRYYSNAFTDMVKQDAMNLFLGCFIPNESTIPLWDLESDYYLHNRDLHPNAPEVYKVIYADVLKDSDAIKDSHFKSRLESAIKKAFSEWYKSKDSEVSSVLNRTGSGDSLNSSDKLQSSTDWNIVSESMKLGVKIDVAQLFRRYCIKAILADKQSAKIKGKTAVNNSVIRAVARLERRKFMRIVTSRRISVASPRWWQTALEDYAHVLGIWDRVEKAEVLSNNYYVRFHKPYNLSEFDSLFSMEFFNPLDAVESLSDLTKKKNLRISAEYEKEDATHSPSATDPNGAEVDNGLMPYGLSSLFSFYPTLASSVYGGDPATNLPSATSYKASEIQTNETSYKTNAQSDTTLSLTTPSMNYTVGDEDRGLSPSQPGNSGFQITKYVREIGLKARTLVGGFLRKEESILTPSNGQRRTRTISGESGNGSRRNSEISMLRHTVTKASMSLYKRYRDCFENSLLLTQDKEGKFLEDEYNALLKDIRVDVDNVKAMENLAADGYICAQINRGVFQGLSQNSSAVLAYGFLFSSIVNIESELEYYGNYVDQKASVSRDAGFAVHTNEQSPTVQALSTMRKTSMILSNEVQERIVKSILRSKVAYGLEVELKKNVNNYIFQQYTYNKEISFERLSRRISPYTPERTIIEYCAQFDFDILASDLTAISYLASSSPGYSSFRDLMNLKQNLEAAHRQFEIMRNEQLREFSENIMPLPSVVGKKRLKLLPKTVQREVSTISSELGITVDGLIEDLKTNYDLSAFGVYGYPQFPYNTDPISADEDLFRFESDHEGFSSLGPDLYSKMTNPHLQLNEIAVIQFKQILHV